jgi:hypothetical protein
LAHAATIRSQLPAGNVELRRWLRSPSGRRMASCS